MAGEPTSGDQANEGTDLRKMERIDTDRIVRFSNTKFTGPLHEGIATDMSPSGLRIETHHPESRGVEIEIELPPKPGDQDAELVYFTGRIVHVTPLENGASAMGIRLAQGSNIGDRIRGGAKGLGGDKDSGPARSLRERVSQAISLGVTIPTGLEASAVARPSSDTELAPRGPRWRMPRFVPRIALLLLVLLLAIWLMGLDGDNDDRATASLALGFSERLLGPEMEEPEKPPPESGVVARSPVAKWSEAMRSVAEPLDGQLATPAEFLGRAQAALIAGRAEEAAELFSHLESHPKVTPIQRFLSLLGHAESADVRGDRGMAAMLVRKAMELRAEVPGPWTAAARELESSLSAPGDAGGSIPAFSELVNLRSAGGAVLEAVPALSVEVDTARYVLRIIENGAVVRSFPVGLGRDGTTPLGDFEIANKITNPDWYNRGEVVPAGDPKNPLGSRWMGLGTDGKATSYGIHPTSEAESIGKNQSEGCVRMRPADAEEVFRRCPIGTPVRIHR